jgi:hypothetical protein
VVFAKGGTLDRAFAGLGDPMQAMSGSSDVEASGGVN